MTIASIQTALARISQSPDPESLWALLRSYLTDLGAEQLCYHHYNPLGAAKLAPGGGPTMIHEGFPQSWVDEYVDCRYVRFDPIVEMALRSGAPFSWHTIGQLTDLSEQQQKLLVARRQAGLSNGVALGLFGPNLRNGYASLGFAPNKLPSQTGLQELQLILQAAHLKFCNQTQTPNGQDLHLAAREQEVLEWIACGKSTASIAQIMGVSRHTVDTLTRRIFSKLDVTDRTSAVLTGIASGFLRTGTQLVA